MRILVTGATGFVGKKLVKKLVLNGHQVSITTRNKSKAMSQFSLPINIIEIKENNHWPQEAFQNTEGPIEGVINLMGENIADGRWTEKRKKEILDSRVEGSKKLIEGILKYAPNINFISSASAIGYYPVGENTLLKEDNLKANGFLADVCYQWEQAVLNSPLACRKVVSRIGVVFGREGGALAKLLPIFKLGAGGPIGSGKSMMSWIHVDDLASWLSYTAENKSINGIYNAVAGYCSNSEMTKTLAKALHRPAIFPVPPFMLKIIFGEMSSIILDSQTVSSTKINSSGFKFQYGDLNLAMDEVAGSKTIIDGKQPHRIIEDTTYIEKKK
jgi:uncharacterized protein (TIGR01777 family)